MGMAVSTSITSMAHPDDVSTDTRSIYINCTDPIYENIYGVSDVSLYGGLNHKFVDEPRHLSKYICAICTLVSRDPQQVTCCGHIYCKSCLLQLKENSPVLKCPTCTHPLKDGEYFPDKRATLDINSLRIHCPNDENDCDGFVDGLYCNWEGELLDLDLHLQQTCPLQFIPCTEGCGVKVRRDDLNDHLLNNCPLSVIKCEYCTAEGIRENITGPVHIEECPRFPLNCSVEGCGLTLVRKEMVIHICPKEVISCEYSTVGCTDMFKREEKEKHNEQCMRQHLQLAVRKVAEIELVLENYMVSSNQKHQRLVAQSNEKIANLELALKVKKQILKITDVSSSILENHPKTSKKFYSSVHGEGYHMYLIVRTNENHQYLSCFVYFTKGRYDDTLEWAFQGEVIIELLNQLEDNNHRVKSVVFGQSAKAQLSVLKPTNSKDTTGLGFRKFISLNDLGYKASHHCQYLKDNTLYFRVSVHHKPVSEKLWLIS